MASRKVTDIDWGRYGLTPEEIAQFQKRSPVHMDAKKISPMARTNAPVDRVLQSRVWRAYHADRFEQGASDGLAIEAWCAWMDERQKIIHSAA